MPTVIENLEKFNRKERFFLVGKALGNPKFILDPSFRKALESKFKLTIPADAFVAMDYHLNWIYAACALAFEQPYKDRIYNNVDRIVDGTQEDVDLIVAYQDRSGVYNLIMLEAKGVTYFSNGQFIHKVGRLKHIFRDDGKRWPQVAPYFGLVSPKESKRLKYEICPSWLKIEGKIPWFEMEITPARLAVYGCNIQGKRDKNRNYWSVRE